MINTYTDVHAGQNEKRSKNLQKICRPTKIGAWIRYFSPPKKACWISPPKTYTKTSIVFVANDTAIVGNGVGGYKSKGWNLKFNNASDTFAFV
jgi:hypothetical protein